MKPKTKEILQAEALTSDRKELINVKTSIFRKIGKRNLESVRQLVGSGSQSDTVILEMLVGLMTNSEWMELSSVFKYYVELSNANNKKTKI
jgi:hypothetical protein